ncbi:hypothetical protein MSUIS_04270 [Mycoplasma suis KI3806]|uniref:Uncharacterized protein n=1 Tax=Mycoplasma suis (strain KI_3806) TaxID=708248 RepID=F0V1I9_MYCS3|nr:hypothetical protein [Mycoplasma suis]CBZ40520.1 hypothetical protein MSUIS_04270 [Mycoplasma suis KI3806]
MSEERGKGSPLFLDPKKIREILIKGSESLQLSASDEEINDTVKLIESMQNDLLDIYNMPLNDEVSKDFHSHEELTLDELDKFLGKKI